jgi:hypothetical protein
VLCYSSIHDLVNFLPGLIGQEEAEAAIAAEAK